MSPQTSWRLELGAWWVSVCAIAAALMTAAGCASWQGPRIDPTGRSLVVWPNQAPPAVVAAPTTAPPFAGFAPPGNVQAAPVFSGESVSPLGPAPMVPAMPAQPGVPAPAHSGGVPSAAVPTTALPSSMVTAHGGFAPIGQDYVRISPDRVLAPVGSEVVLKAGLCTANGYLLANHRVEWALERSGAGQFVELGERGEVDLFRWPWDTPRKVDNWFAVGSTAYAPICLDRGTPDPNDDVQVLRGEAWITVTSATEGTSYVTAYAPAINNWQFRRATATVYWVDAQWVFPPSASAAPGRPHVLTTTVMRRTNAAPLAGWIVRYEAVGGGAALGYDGGSFVEVPTDAAGRASVEVSPASGGSGSSTIAMTLVRPAQAGPDASPQLEIGRGTAVITWGTPVAPPQTTTPAPVTPIPQLEPTPTTPREPSPSDRYPTTTPRDEPPPGRAELEVRFRRYGPEEVDVGEFVRFDITVTNRGNGTARGIELLDRFDRGLRHPEAQPNEFAVKYPGMRDLAPGQSETVTLTFEVVAAGRQCHEVTVTAEGGVRAVDRACVTGRQAAPPAQPVLDVTMTGHTHRYVGEIAAFRTVLRNNGEVPITNIEIVGESPPVLEPTDTSVPEDERLPDGRIVWRIARLEVGGRHEIVLQSRCTAASRSACNSVTVTADGGIHTKAEVCVEVVAPLQPGAPGAAEPDAPRPGNITLSLTERVNPVPAGQRTTIYARVENTGSETQRQVEVWLLFPAEMTIDAAGIRPPGDATVLAQEVRFRAIAELAPGARRDFEVPATADRAGTVNVRGRVSAAGMAEPLMTQSGAISILPPTQ